MERQDSEIRRIRLEIIFHMLAEDAKLTMQVKELLRYL